MPTTQSHLQFADYFVLVGYFTVMLGIGAYFYRGMRGMKDYFSGGNQIPWWLSGVSHYMSCFSAFAFVFNSALVYQYGWVGITLFWAQIPGTLLCALVFSRIWRRARTDSPVEYLEARFNSSIRQICAWLGIPIKVIDDALKLVAIGVFFSVSLGLGLKESMVGAGLVILVYTFMGGLWAVVVTDFIQFVVMGAAVLVLFVLSMAKAGGIGAVLFHSPPGSFRPVNAEFGWLYVGCMVFLYALSMSSVHWQLIQKFCCVPNEREARKTGLLVVFLHIVTPVLMFSPALAARRFLMDVEPKEIYPALCSGLLPPGLLGLIIAAMLASTMSHLSSDYNACASVLTNDVYRRLIRPRSAQRELVQIGRVATALMGLAALIVALVFAHRGSAELYRAMALLFSVGTPPVAVPMVLGLLSTRMSARGALAGLLSGLGVGLLLFMTTAKEVAVWGTTTISRENVVLILSTLTTAAVMVVVSEWGSQSAAEGQRIAAFFRRLAAPIGGLAEDHGSAGLGRAGAVSPFRIVGISTACVGVIMLAVVPWIAGGMALGMDAGIGVALILLGAVLTMSSGGNRAPAPGRGAAAEAAAGSTGAAEAAPAGGVIRSSAHDE